MLKETATLAIHSTPMQSVSEERKYKCRRDEAVDFCGPFREEYSSEKDAEQDVGVALDRLEKVGFA